MTSKTLKGKVPRLETLCVQWPGLGPYHLARLKATHQLLQKHDMKLVALETAGSMGSLAWEVTAAEVPFERIQLFPGRVFNDISPAEMDFAVRAALDRIRPDAVATHSYFLPDTRAALRWCRKERRVAITMVDSKEDDASRVRWREAIKSIIIRQYDAALVAGTPHRAYMRKLGLADDCIFEGYDVVDNSYFADAASKARSRPDAYRHLPGLFDDPSSFFLVSSRFIPRKNLTRLLSAYGQYRSQSSHPWRLVILGGGRLSDSLQEKVEREGLEGVTFAGMRPLEDVCAYYAFAQALIHPASVDQWGLVVNEAMAAGLPVIVSTGSGCALDLVHPPQNGFLFEPTDVTGLVDAMMQMSSDGVDRVAMGAESRRLIEEWSPERFARGIYNAAVCGRRTDPRGLGLLPRFLLWLMLRTSRSAESFAAVEM